MIRNERGSVLLYVLMSITIFMLFIPLMLNMVYASGNAGKMEENEKQVTLLATSGMEATMQYLISYTGNSKRTYLNSYSGWGEKTIVTPEGQTIYYKQFVAVKDTKDKVELPLSTNGQYDIITVAVIGDTNHNYQKDSGETFYKEKELKYGINATDSTGGGNAAAIDPDHKVAVQTGKTVLHGGSKGKASSATPNLQSAITTYLSSLKNNVENSITAFQTSSNPVPITCSTCNTLKAVKDKIDQLPSGNLIIFTVPALYSNNETVQLGSASKPVILITTGMSSDNDNTLTIYGNLINTGNIGGNGKMNMNAYKVNGLYGNIWVKGQLFAQNNIKIRADGQVYAGSMQYNSSGVDISANQIVVDGQLTLNNSITKFESATDMVAGGIYSQSANLTAVAGDIFVKNDIKTSNNVTLKSGGVIAAGNNIEYSSSTSFVTGTSTALNLDVLANGGGGSGGTSTPNDWNPIRQK